MRLVDVGMPPPGGFEVSHDAAGFGLRGIGMEGRLLGSRDEMETGDNRMRAECVVRTWIHPLHAIRKPVAIAGLIVVDAQRAGYYTWVVPRDCAIGVDVISSPAWVYDDRVRGGEGAPGRDDQCELCETKHGGVGFWWASCCRTGASESKGSYLPPSQHKTHEPSKNNNMVVVNRK